MRPGTAISIALAALEARNGEFLGFRSDIVEEVQKLQRAGITVSGIRVRPTIEGLNSAEVSDFIGRMAMSGYLVQESPIRLTEAGRRLIQRQLEDEWNVRPDQLRTALEAVGLDITQLSREQVHAG